MADNVANIVTNQIIERLKEGEIPWHQTWSGGKGPVNYVTQKPYKGINRWLLMGGSGEFLTFKQIQNIKGAKLKKGSKSRIVVFYKSCKKIEKDENDEEYEKSYKLLRYYRVFDIADCEGIKSKREPDEEKVVYSIDECEEVFNSYFEKYNISFQHTDRTSCFYSPSLDMVNVPPIEEFDNSESYYASLAHESGHSTGHSTRLNRDLKHRFGTKEYAREELVAELSAAILCELLGISTEDILDNSVAYCQSWLKRLQDDASLILYASAKAEKAVELIAPQLYTVQGEQ